MILYSYDQKTKLLQGWYESDTPNTVPNSTTVSPFSSHLSTVPEWDSANNRWVDSDQELVLTQVPDFSYSKQLSDIALQVAKLNANVKGSGK